MHTEPQLDMESIGNADRRIGLLIGLGIVGLVMLVVGLLVVAGPARSAFRSDDTLDDLEDLAAEALD
jgi:hypothetical protein